MQLRRRKLRIEMGHSALIDRRRMPPRLVNDRPRRSPNPVALRCSILRRGKSVLKTPSPLMIRVATAERGINPRRMPTAPRKRCRLPDSGCGYIAFLIEGGGSAPGTSSARTRACVAATAVAAAPMARILRRPYLSWRPPFFPVIAGHTAKESDLVAGERHESWLKWSSLFSLQAVTGQRIVFAAHPALSVVRRR